MEKSVKKHTKSLPVIEVCKEQGVLGLSFRYNRTLVEIVRTIPKRRWDSLRKIWWVPDTIPTREILRESFRGKARFAKAEEDADKAGSLEAESVLQMRQFMLKLNFHPGTIDTYLQHFQEYLGYFPMRDPAGIAEKEVRTFLDVLVKVKDITPGYLEQTILAIRFYYEQVLGRAEMNLSLPGTTVRKSRSQLLRKGIAPQVDDFLRSA